MAYTFMVGALMTASAFNFVADNNVAGACLLLLSASNIFINGPRHFYEVEKRLPNNE